MAGSRWSTVEEASTASRIGGATMFVGGSGSKPRLLRSSVRVSSASMRARARAHMAGHAVSPGSTEARSRDQVDRRGSQWSSGPRIMTSRIDGPRRVPGFYPGRTPKTKESAIRIASHCSWSGSRRGNPTIPLIRYYENRFRQYAHP